MTTPALLELCDMTQGDDIGVALAFNTAEDGWTASKPAKPEAGQAWPTSADDYELLDECGKGVSAEVYRARCFTNDRIVGVKALNLEWLATPLDEVMHEAQLMKAYKHDAILPLYCSFVTGQELWMVMPYMEGGSVAHILRYKYPEGLSEVVIATIMRKVLEALAYVHKQGDIHRDVKAGNVLVDGEGNVKLGDFGVAATPEREADWRGPKTRNTFVGTPCWMAPEVLEQVSGYGTSADIWSFGITILEMAHGHAPFSKLPPMKVLLMTLQGPPPQLEASCGSRHFSRGMREVVARCLNKDPKKRPTAKELLEHKFFKQAKDAEFLKRTLLADLPPLPQRCNEIRAGKAATMARENERASLASHISYVTDVAHGKTPLEINFLSARRSSRRRQSGALAASFPSSRSSSSSSSSSS
ncbi:hypothetical protein OEZ86_008578 [Tetradesmus obliquus]|nr:hypothetical protein OEZ86_008578 [Tetradesmus obliquus]